MRSFIRRKQLQQLFLFHKLDIVTVLVILSNLQIILRFTKIQITFCNITTYSAFHLDRPKIPPVRISYLVLLYYTYYMSKLPSWSHLVPISFWKSSIDDSGKNRRFSSLYYVCISHKSHLTTNLAMSCPQFYLMVII